jgi:hypothetical protein
MATCGVEATYANGCLASNTSSYYLGHRHSTVTRTHLWYRDIDTISLAANDTERAIRLLIISGQIKAAKELAAASGYGDDSDDAMTAYPCIEWSRLARSGNLRLQLSKRTDKEIHTLNRNLVSHA